ncbi:DUF2306 domain-containing protein [Frankia sp. AiPs1]|nr:DUF2306 domain-containing protein [Frankia sp. AiPs1]
MTTIDHPAGRPLPGPRRRRTTVAAWWYGLSTLAIAVFAVVPYLTSSLRDQADQGNEVAINYVDRSTVFQVFLYLHIAFGGVALLLSPLQLSARVRARVPRLHRVVGRITVAAICLAGTAGAALSTVNLAGPIGTAGFGLLAVLWASFAVTAVRAIRRGDVPAHRRWAIRTFALTYAAVTLRLWMLVMSAVQIGAGTDSDVAFDRAYHVVPFLCWVPNLLVAQWLLTRPDPTPTARPRLS